VSAFPLPFYDDPLLFGRDPTPGLVAFAPAPASVRVFARRPSGLTTEEVPFRPFIILADPDLLRGFRGEVALARLDGEAAFGWLAELSSWKEAERARDHCRRVSGRAPGAPEAPYRFLADPTHQFLLRAGQTSFRGMRFEDLHRLALDIEVLTGPGFEFPNAARPDDRIIAVALADSSGFATVLSGATLSEADLLAECSRLIRERDPDVIEGHNIFRFDLEYIEARAHRLGIELRWGRDGSPLRGRPSRMQVAERSIAYRRYQVTGRHIVDTWILAQLYDVGARDLPSYGLKDVARHFALSAPGRTYVAGDDIPRLFREDPDRLEAYARDDALETLAVSAVLSQPYFVQAQALPFDYETVVLRGNATKIDALLMREYLRRGAAVPRPGAGGAVAGGYTAMFQRGVARDVLHVDVTSLYPSLMLAQGIAPSRDRLGVFGALLRDLTRYRLAAKRLAREATAEADRGLIGALQQTFKILINSFYGYLGFAPGHWNDFDAANRVTAEGRRLVMALVDHLRSVGATVIEVDTDGLYFVPPASPTGTPPADLEEALQAELAALLPAGIQLELAGRYPAMFSYKMKNYVLRDPGGRLIVKGSGLRSRGLELFQRRCMEQMVDLLLSGRRAEIPALMRGWEEDFRAHRIDVRHFMKTETLQESPGTYMDKVRAGLRNASAPYELALRSERPYQPGDQVSYYVSGQGARVKVNEAARLASSWDPAAPDENTDYYLAKLRDLYEKFRPFVEREGLVPVDEEDRGSAPRQEALEIEG
jgi:DNA polymerase elongation subunit (family B)